ncbi:glutathione peroxidase [Micromonospora peucetia]|uniref:Glutathione peroxidase n=1 Tax=Micromonospora peucetia TaxID=47871 RepID=A0A1C6VPT1_9ACTN|nr:glutathione peroxidase [Micromonospora peucetia]MCX4388558.1 glutathione peroxidase [Micromonospora peucetia]WSA30786.1 glutathione peroxidase [Micromonospora peucetia]SCL68313.1 glutathione peroxidase [Micromonospora peucetia]
MTVFDTRIDALAGGPADLAQYRGRALLVVNVASRCGLTPQYAGLQALHDEYADRGLVVLGVPCNQFAGQEPGSAAEISDFCQVNFGVTFPLTEKIDVNGPGRHPLYAALVGTADAEGHTGDVRWNFEKFLVAPDGTVAARFAPTVEPTSADLRAAIEKVLPPTA